MALRTHIPGPRRRRAAALVASIALVLAVACAPVRAWALDDPSIDGTAALLVDADTGAVLYESNADETRYPASITKVMTAIVVLENADLDDTVTVEEGDFAELTSDSTVAGFKAGEELTVEQLLYGMLLPSGNDAAYILARGVGGSVDAFVEKMNAKARELGCTGTHFVNPCGLHDDEHYSCARDIYRMVSAAMENETFAKIVSTETYQMPATNLQSARTIENTNHLLDKSASTYYAPAIGVKTGNTTEAGRCLAGAASQDGITLYSVVLGCDGSNSLSAINATKSLFEWGYGNFSMQEVAGEGDALDKADVVDAAGGAQVELDAASDLEALLPDDADPSDIEVSYDLADGIAAPVDRGDELGEATFSYDGQKLGTVKLVAGNSVNIDAVALLRNIALAIVGSLAFKVAVVAVVLVIALLVATTVRGRRREAERRRAVLGPRGDRGRSARTDARRSPQRSRAPRRAAPRAHQATGSARGGRGASGAAARSGGAAGARPTGRLGIPHRKEPPSVSEPRTHSSGGFDADGDWRDW